MNLTLHIWRQKDRKTDGKMVTYGAMVLVSALALWWAGWGTRRG